MCCLYTATRAAAAIAEETGAACLTLDLGGHGDSPGERDGCAIAQHLAQVVTAHEYLASRPYVDRERVGLVGTSFGGYLAVRAAVVLPDTPQRLLLRAPAWFPDGLENQSRHAYPSQAIRRYRNRLGSRGSFTFDHTHHATAQFKGPLTIVAPGTRSPNRSGRSSNPLPWIGRANYKTPGT